MADPRSSYIGLEVSSTTLRIIELIKVEGKAYLKNFYILDLKDPHLNKSIEKIFFSVAQKREVILVIDTNKLILKRLRIPSMPLTELLEAIKWEMKEFLPFNINEAMLEFNVLGEVEEGGVKKYDISVACASKEVIYTPLNLLASIGVFSHLVITPTCALENLIKALSYHFEPATANSLLYIGGDDSQMLILRDKATAFWRQIFIGTTTSSTAPPTSQSQEGVPAEMPKADFLNYLIPEVKRTRDHYFEESQGILINEMLLFGGEGKNLPEIASVFSGQLPFPVKVGDPFLGIDILPGFSQDHSALRVHAQELVLATGAALSVSSAINLLPVELKKATERFYKRFSFIVATALSMVLFVFLLNFLYIQIKRLKIQLNSLTIESEAAAPQTEELTKRESLQQKIDERKSILEHINCQKMPFSEALKEISNIIPAESVLKELRFEENRFILSGEIYSRESSVEEVISDFSRRLDRGIFKNIKLIQVVRDAAREDLSTFQFSFNLDEPSVMTNEIK